MSKHIAQVLKTNYDAFAVGNSEPLLNSLADNIRWRVSGGSPLVGEYSGRDSVLSFFGKMMELYEGTLRVSLIDILCSEHRGVVLTDERCTYRGRQLLFKSVHLWEMPAGKFTSFEVYYDDAYHKFWPLG